MKNYRAKITVNGSIPAFAEGLKYDNGESVYCEVSAVVYDGEHLIFSNDKPIPSDSITKRSPVFFMKYADFPAKPTGFYTAPAFMDTQKIEAFTLTPDEKYVIATTAFDRVHPSGGAKFDYFNTLLMWTVGKPDSVKVISPSTRDGVTSSVRLREKILSILKSNRFDDEIAYFKLESITALPNQKIILGVREFGKDYKRDNFDYVIKLIAVSYEIFEDEIILADDFQVIYDFDPTEKLAGFDLPVGLSSIEYDKYHNRLYFLTSYEDNTKDFIKDEDIGAFLWVLPLDDLDGEKELQLVTYKDSSERLLFAHKAEGLAVINEKELLVVHDDDRVTGRRNIKNHLTQFSKKPNEFAYSIVEFLE